MQMVVASLHYMASALISLHKVKCVTYAQFMEMVRALLNYISLYLHPCIKMK
jgi:hypothetical protein